MKTKKFSISFDSLENEMSTEIFISEKEYYKQLCFLLQQVEKSKNQDSEYRIEKIAENHHQNEKMITDIIYFQNCTATTTLKKYICKKGYCFNVKRTIKK